MVNPLASYPGESKVSNDAECIFAKAGRKEENFKMVQFAIDLTFIEEK